MPELDADGATLFYETAGHISLPAVLVIHRDAADVASWDDRIETLARTRFVIRLLPESTPAADPVDLLDHLGVLRATVLTADETDAAELLVAHHPDRLSLDSVE